MATHTLLHVGLPHVKGFHSSWGEHCRTVWDSSLSSPGPIPKNMRNPLTCGRPIGQTRDISGHKGLLHIMFHNETISI